MLGLIACLRIALCFRLLLRGNTGELIIGIAIPIVLHLHPIDIDQRFVIFKGHAGVELRRFRRWPRRRQVVLGHWLAHLQLAIAGQRRDMRQGEGLRISLKAAKLHLLGANRHRELEIAEFLIGGEMFGFWRCVASSGH